MTHLTAHQTYTSPPQCPPTQHIPHCPPIIYQLTSLPSQHILAHLAAHPAYISLPHCPTNTYQPTSLPTQHVLAYLTAVNFAHFRQIKVIYKGQATLQLIFIKIFTHHNFQLGQEIQTMDETRISGCWSSLNFFPRARQNFLILEQPAGMKVN